MYALICAKRLIRRIAYVRLTIRDLTYILFKRTRR